MLWVWYCQLYKYKSLYCHQLCYWVFHQQYWLQHWETADALFSSDWSIMLHWRLNSNWSFWNGFDLLYWLNHDKPNHFSNSSPSGIPRESFPESGKVRDRDVLLEVKVLNGKWTTFLVLDPSKDFHIQKVKYCSSSDFICGPWHFYSPLPRSSDYNLSGYKRTDPYRVVHE